MVSMTAAILCVDRLRVNDVGEKMSIKGGH
jgi:hypothetical protein